MYDIPDYLKPEDGEHKWSGISITGLGDLQGSNFQLETLGPFLIITRPEPKIVNASIFIPFYTSQISESDHLIVTLLYVQEQSDEIYLTFSTTADAEYFNDVFFSRLLSANKTLSSTSPQLCSTQGQFLVLLPGQQTPESAFGNVQVMRDKAEFQVHMIKRIPIICGKSYILTKETIIATSVKENPLVDITKLSCSIYIKNFGDNDYTQILCNTPREAMLWVICLYAFSKYAGRGGAGDHTEISHTRKKIKKRSKPAKQISGDSKKDEDKPKTEEIKETSENNSNKTQAKEEINSPGEQNPANEETKEEPIVEEIKIEPKIENEQEIVIKQENETEEEEDNDSDESGSQIITNEITKTSHNYSHQFIPSENKKYRALKNFPLTNQYITITVPSTNSDIKQYSFDTLIPTSDYALQSKDLDDKLEIKFDINQKIDPYNYDIAKTEEMTFERNEEAHHNISKLSIEQIISNSIESMPNDIICPAIPSSDYFDLESLCGVIISEYPKESQLDIRKYYNFKNPEILLAKKPNSVFYNTLFSIISEIRISWRNLHWNDDLSINLAAHIAILFSNGFNSFYSFDNFINEIKETIIDKHVLKDLSKAHDAMQFSLIAIQNKVILHVLRTIRRNEVIFQKFFHESALIRNAEMVIQLSNQLEPLLFYNTFDYTNLDMRRVTFPVYIGYEFLALNYLPRYKGNNDLICKTISNIVHVGITPAKLWARIEELKEFQKESEDMNEMITFILQIPKSKGTASFEALLNIALEKNKLFLWLAQIFDHLNIHEMPIDSTLADPYRASLLLKSVYLLQIAN